MPTAYFCVIVFSCFWFSKGEREVPGSFVWFFYAGKLDFPQP